LKVENFDDFIIIFILLQDRNGAIIPSTVHIGEKCLSKD